MNRGLSKKIILVMLGALCFLVSQVVLRIPLLNFISNNLSLKISMSYGFLLGILQIISAGVFEEGFRFLFRQFLLRDDKFKEKGLISFDNTIKDAIIFGLGHGLCEVGFVVVLAFSSSVPTVANTLLILYERFLAVVFHVSMTVIVFRGFNINRKFSSLVLAVFLHSLFNLPILFLSQLGIIGLYTLMSVMTVLIFKYIFKKIKKGEIV